MKYNTPQRSEHKLPGGLPNICLRVDGGITDPDHSDRVSFMPMPSMGENTTAVLSAIVRQGLRDHDTVHQHLRRLVASKFDDNTEDLNQEIANTADLLLRIGTTLATDRAKLAAAESGASIPDTTRYQVERLMPRFQGVAHG
jgi:hypothetical protein